MSAFKVSLLTMMAFCFTLASAYYIDGKRSEYLRENKVFMGDIEKREKRYVSDREDADAETRRYKGWEKMYVGEESAEEYFYREKEALYRFTSLQRNTPPPKDAKDKLAVIVEEEKVLDTMNSANVEIEEKEMANINKERGGLNKERVSLDNKRVISSKERVSLDNKRVISSKERVSLDNKRVISSKERVSLNNKRIIPNNKRAKLDILEVVFE